MMEIMGLSYGFLLLDPQDYLYRLPVAPFNRMLSAPATVRVPRFADNGSVRPVFTFNSSIGSRSRLSA